MNSQRKNYPMKEFRAIFPISLILVIRSRNAKKIHFPILAVFQNVWDLHKFGLQIWIQNAKITLWKNFWQFFQFHRFSCKKRSFLNISCNLTLIYGIYINLGYRFEFRTQKLPYERISGNFSDFIDFGHQVRVCKKRSHLNISCNSKKYGIYINLGCRFEFRTQKLPYETILGNFLDFIDFGHQVRVIIKKNVIYINLGCRFEFRTQKLPYERISGNFFDFIDFSHQVRVCKKRSRLNISCNSKNMGLT